MQSLAPGGTVALGATQYSTCFGAFVLVVESDDDDDSDDDDSDDDDEDVDDDGVIVDDGVVVDDGAGDVDEEVDAAVDDAARATRKNCIIALWTLTMVCWRRSTTTRS